MKDAWLMQMEGHFQAADIKYLITVHCDIHATSTWCYPCIDTFLTQICKIFFKGFHKSHTWAIQNITTIRKDMDTYSFNTSLTNPFKQQLYKYIWLERINFTDMKEQKFQPK